MKILFITGSLNQGGAEYQILELAKLFQEKGHIVKLFAITDYSFYIPFVRENKLEYSHLLNHQSSIKRVFLTTKMVRKERPDLIISYLRKVSQVALFAKVFSGVKTKIIIGERTSNILPIYDRFYFNLMRFANYLTVNSITKVNYLKKTFPSLQRKIAFLPNIIDIEKFAFLNKNFKSNICNIGFVGRISPEKNVINLIKAIKIVIDGGENVELLLFGDTRNVEYLKNVNDTIKECNLEKRVFIKGRSNNINNAYKEIDLLCLISDYEGFSNVLSEGLACGLPIITSTIEENIYLVEDQVNGFIVNHKDPQNIANGIYEYLNLSIELKTQMTKHNRKKAEKIFNNEKIYEEYMNIFNSL